MKKKLLVGLFAVIMCFALIGCEKANKISLDDIAKNFNNSEIVKSYKNYGYNIEATVSGNKLTITTELAGEKSSVVYTLDGNILGNESLSDMDILTAAFLIDSVGQLQGYKEGELVENLNAFADEIENYTLEKEGFELKQGNNKNSLKIDLTKKIPLKDMSNFYLKTSDFDMIKQFVDEKNVGNQNGKNAKLAYDVAVHEEDSEIIIGETDKLTDSAYKSILSALEVIYGKDVVNKFKTAYPSFKEEKTTVDGFTIDTNYKVENQDDSVFKGMKVVSVTVDNKTVKK